MHHLHPDVGARREHPLVKLLRRIRRRHRKRQADIEACMELPSQALKHIENGHQRLPGLQAGPGLPIGQWIERWLDCVKATKDEREQVRDVLMHELLGRLADELPPDGGHESEGRGRGHR
jgi:hypothetical protein